MKKLILFIIPIFLFGCKKEKDQFNYDFKIIKTISWYDPGNNKESYIFDSCTFFYDNNKKLLAFKKNDLNEGMDYVKYSDGIIQSATEKFVLDSCNRVVEFWNWEGTWVLCEKFVYNKYGFRDNNSTNKIEIFQEEGLIRDSIFLSAENCVYNNCLGVDIFYHSDTLAPFFMINEYGLFELPGKHKYLVDEERSYDNHGLVFQYLHKYFITQTLLVDTDKIIDPFLNKIIEIGVFKYELKRNQ